MTHKYILSLWNYAYKRKPVQESAPWELQQRNKKKNGEKNCVIKKPE